MNIYDEGTFYHYTHACQRTKLDLQFQKNKPYEGASAACF